MHGRIASDVRAALDGFIRRKDYESAMAVHGPGAGDVTYAIDAMAERAVLEYTEKIGRIAPARVLCEGPGEWTTGGTPEICIIIDPIDGTRNLMADLRSAWVLTGVAPDAPARARRLSDLRVSVQTEIPASRQDSTYQFVAVRGEGCRRRTLRPARRHRRAPRFADYRAPRRVDLGFGYYSFLRYLPRERPAIALLESEFAKAAESSCGLDSTRMYDDQWLSAAGQLFLVASGRMRMFADVRGWLAARSGVPTIASHPYDVCAYLLAAEAGSPVHSIDSELSFPPLDAPLDLDSHVSFVAFANAQARDRLLPLVRTLFREHGARAASLCARGVRS
jgi:hypothetical protein